MDGLSQREIAKAVGVSQPTVSEWLSLAGVAPGMRAGPFETLLALCIGEMTKHGVSGPEAASVIAQSRSEVRWLVAGEGRTCWLCLWQNAAGEITAFTACLSQEHLNSVLESCPVSRIIVLHEIAARAAERLASLQEAANA